MPELPDVEVFKRYVDATALHQRITRVDARDAKVLRNVSRATLASSLRGRRLETTRRHGKYLGVQLDSGTWLMLHFGMTGEPRYFKHERDTPEHTRLLVTFSNGYHFAFVNQRRIGTIRLADDFTRFITAQQLGPDALEVDAREFRDLLSDHRGAIKSLLLNQKAIAGVGNIYADEALFQAGVHPKRGARQLDRKTAGRLHRSLRHVLHTAIERKAQPGELPDSWLLPRRQRGGRCPKSHGPLKTVKVSGRTTYFCPKCQPGK